MHVIKVRNVHAALPQGLSYLLKYGVYRESRNGPVWVAPGPVTTHYASPTERVLFWPERDANPFFHFFEGLWTLSGSNDLAFLAQFNSKVYDYSDDGKTWPGAYGYRWSNYFNINQLDIIIEALKENPQDRRCVLSMWSVDDLGRASKDVPCNTHVYFSRTSTGSLDMTVCCRSNDIIWGAYGSNAVVLSMLQEFMAAGIGCTVGSYYQMSNNYHAYSTVMDPMVDKFVGPRGKYPDPYVYSTTEPYKMVNTSISEWRQDLTHLMLGGLQNFTDLFFADVAVPLLTAHQAYKNKEYDKALAIVATQCKAADWGLACQEWLQRRKSTYLQTLQKAKLARAQDDGVSYE